MGAPAVSGKYVSTTSGMNINDYIKCVYEAPIANRVGYFSQLGTKEPYKLTITTTTTNGVTDEPVVTKTNYGELSTGVPSTTPNGFFYLIKLDNGFLVADRMVQWGVTWAEMNSKNYIYGAVFDCEDARTTEYVDIDITIRPTEEGDTATAGTETEIDNSFHDMKKRYRKFEKTAVAIDQETHEEPVYGEDPETGEQVQTGTETVIDSSTTTITHTIRTIYYAKVPDTIAKIANQANEINISVPLGAEAADVDAILADITSVTCTILNNDDTTYTKEVTVTSWDTSEFKKNQAGSQIIYGTLEDLEAVAENPIRNPSEIKASCIVAVAPNQITEIVTTFADLTVPSTTTAAELATQLNTLYPTCTIKHKKHGQDDSEAIERTDVAIIWNTGDYEAGTVGEQTIVGTLEDLSESSIANDNMITPSIKVITEPAQ